MTPPPLAYYLTFATHGYELRGRVVVEADHATDAPPYILNVARRKIVLGTIREICDYREWTLWAAHVRTEQIHAVITSDVLPDRMIRDLKAQCGRRLGKQLREPPKIKRWAPAGSAFFVADKMELDEEIAYTLHGLGEPMDVFDGTKEPTL